MNIQELLIDIVSHIPGDTPELDAQVLLAHVLNVKRTWISAHPEAQLTISQVASVKEAVSRLRAGTPLPHVLGRWEFFGLDFEVTPDVLIPRPETELLVERAVEWLQESPGRRTIADIGTGSGCIAAALATHIPDAHITATEISQPALDIARRNARRLHVADRIDFIQCDLLPPQPGPLPTELPFDLICANLPYIPSKTLKELPIYMKEPSLALEGGRDGLEVVRRLLDLAPSWMAPQGMILLEIEASQGMAALSLAYDSFEVAHIHLYKDLSGLDRLVEIRL